jgi:hypothetical protein
LDEAEPSTPKARPRTIVSFATGLVFLLGAACVVWAGFPTLVRFRCDRATDTCSLEQSNLLRRQTTLLRARSVTGARVETVGGDGTTYRVWVDTREGSIAFTGYSIGTSPDEKYRVATAVTAFVRDGATTCEATQDERLAFSFLAAGLAAVGLVASAFGAFSSRA